jgi:hypothetical protein
MRRFRELTTETAGFYNTGRLQRRHARVPVDPGAPRSGAARRLQLPRTARRRASHRRRRGGCGRRRSCVSSAQASVQTLVNLLGLSPCSRRPITQRIPT